MAVTLEMPKDVEAQFSAAARAQGVPLSDYLRDVIVEHYLEDAEDLRLAQERLSDSRPSLSSGQLRKNLGLPSRLSL